MEAGDAPGSDVVDGDSALGDVNQNVHRVSGDKRTVAADHRCELEWVSVLGCFHPVKLLEADSTVQLPEEQVWGVLPC